MTAMGSLWHRSGTIERYGNDIPASNAVAYFYLGGTTSPLTTYQDAECTSAHPFPVQGLASGRWPDIFLPWTVETYDCLVRNKFGVQLTYSINVPNIRPPEEDPTTKTAAYVLKTDTTATDPGAKNVKFNNVVQASATRIYISSTDNDGRNLDSYWSTVPPGSEIAVQDKSDSSIIKRFVIDAITDMTGWWDLTVTPGTSSGADMPNNEQVLVGVRTF